MSDITDKERLDFLQKLTDDAGYTGKTILRNSTTGRGWRLHETSWPGAVENVREAIDNYIKQSEFEDQLKNSKMDENHNHLNDELK